MAVALVTGIYPPDVGGPATHAFDVAAALRERGYEVSVVTLTDEARKVSGDGLVRFPRRWPWPVRLAAVVREVTRRQSDMIYALGLHEAAAAAAWLTGRPLVVRVPGDHAWERARRLGLTDLSFEAFQAARGGGPRLRAMRWLRTWSTRQADTLVVPSRYLEAAVRRWAPAARIEVVPIGVDAPAAARTGPSARGELRALWVGRLVAPKRLDVLVEAVAMTSSTRLVIVGDGPERGRLEALARRLEVDNRVEFRGQMPRDAVWQAMAESDVLLLVSEHEGLPHVAIEALAAGLPVVAPDAPWAREVVEEGETGVLVAEATPEAFAQVLTGLRQDPERLERLAKGARARAGQWSLQAMVDRVEETLRSAASRPPVVFVGKGGLEPPESTPAKFAILARHLRPTVVSVRPTSGSAPPLPARVLAFPRRPKPLASALFYAVAPMVALGRAVREHAVVVSQSPYEAAPVLAVRALLPRRLRPPVVVEVHGDWRTASRLYGSRTRRLLAPLADAVAAFAVRRADRLRAVSASMDALARAAGYRGEIDRFVTFSDFSAFLDPPVRPLPTAPVALFVGVLEAPKAPEVLIDAWCRVANRLPTARLVMVGEGPLRATLEETVRRLGLPGRIKFLGTVPRPRLVDLLDEAWCLVLPSRSEGLPRVILEAMGRGRAVVASRVGGIPELVEDHITGLLVPPEDPIPLAEALVKVLSDRSLAEAMGLAGRARAEARDPAREFEEGVARLAAWARGVEGG
ncbi:MAG: glycosyltransferase family 4 protein [Armatimonadota bacterium]|nr:glycosyltransferase family 4 protein [Armatimonadota bacterium]